MNDWSATAPPARQSLRFGDTGGAVGDLQRRLSALGFGWIPDDAGHFGAATRAAVEAFQHLRGLRVDGVCGEQTWSALVEAGFRLGDRLLYLRAPMLRGDDVAELQRRLSSLGFDTGRVDGILGERTAAAVAEFQLNMGLAADGVVGPGTLRDLNRVMPRHGPSELGSTVRDREDLRRAPRTLVGRRIAIGEEGGLDALVTAIRRRLVKAGAQVVPVLHRDGSAQAAAANTAGVEAYVGLRLEPTGPCCDTAYYARLDYESSGGRRLAELVAPSVAPVLEVVPGPVRGMSIPVLRETRMPAVICEIGPAALVVQRTSLLADAVVRAVTAWVTTPISC